MHRCKDCRIVLDDDVRFCPKCGRDLAVKKPHPANDKSNVEMLLASANLHKMRSEWDAAISDATDALRLDSRNPDVASLIGDIYIRRGMQDEALIWYQMALEIAPDNPGNKERLDKLSKEIADRRREEGIGSFMTFEKHTKAWTFSLAGVFVLIVAIALMITLLKPKTNVMPVARPTMIAPEPSQMSAPTEEPIPSKSDEPKQSKEIGAASSAGSSMRTTAESTVQTGLAAAQSITEAGITIDDVIADPRSNVVTVTFGVPNKGFVSKEQITRAAAQVARMVFVLRQDAQFVTARCVIKTDNAKALIAFVGDASRQGVEALGSNPSDQQLTSIFTRPWWHPEIKQ